MNNVFAMQLAVAVCGWRAFTDWQASGGYGLHPGFVVLSLANVKVLCPPGEADPLDDGEPPDPNDDRRIEELT